MISKKRENPDPKKVVEWINKRKHMHILIQIQGHFGSRKSYNKIFRNGCLVIEENPRTRSELEKTRIRKHFRKRLAD